MGALEEVEVLDRVPAVAEGMVESVALLKHLLQMQRASSGTSEGIKGEVHYI